MRSASNLSTVPWFHSVCASVSMFTIITDNCLFPFLGMFLFLFKVSLCAQIEATVCSYQICVCTNQVCRLCARSIIGSSPFILYWSVGSMACRIPILRIAQYCCTEATIGFVLLIVATFAHFFSFLILTSSSRTCSSTQKV